MDREKFKRAQEIEEKLKVLQKNLDVWNCALRYASKKDRTTIRFKRYSSESALSHEMTEKSIPAAKMASVYQSMIVDIKMQIIELEKEFKNL